MSGQFRYKGTDYYFLHIPKTGGTLWSRIFAHTGLSPGWPDGHRVLKKKPKGYSFAMVRHPLDRLWSCFHYLKEGGVCESDRKDAENYSIVGNTFPQWVEMLDKNPELFFRQQHLMPMVQRIGPRENLDHIGLFQNLIKETQKLSEMFDGLRRMRIPVVNKGSGIHFQECYTQRMKDIVRSVYKEDIEFYKRIVEEHRDKEA